MKNYTFDKRLEGLRGLCALGVAYAHFIGFNFFDSFKIPGAVFLLHFQFAHIAVLVFFIISGYVMGISHINIPFNKGNVVEYLKKRLIRLYPIYLFALFITLIFGCRFISLNQMVGHVFFLQEFLVKTTTTNSSLWSLSFEVVYYLIFLVLWAVNRHSKNLYVGLMTLSAFAALFCNSNNCLQSLLIGWVFWLLGLYFSQLVGAPDNKKTDFKPFISYFFVLLAIYNLESGGFFMRLLHINFNVTRQISFNDLVYLPVCILITLGVTRKHLRYVSWIKVLAYAIPALNILALFYFHHDIRSEENWLYGTAFFAVGLIFLMFKMNNSNFVKLDFIGKISYAIYVFHFAIAFFLDIWLKQYLSGFPLIVVGLIGWLGITFGLSYFAEIIVQPRIKRYFFKPRVA